MIPQVIKSHWKLAFKSVLKAVKVTLQTVASVIRASKYSFSISDKLAEQRRKNNEALEAAANNYLDRMSQQMKKDTLRLIYFLAAINKDRVLSKAKTS